MASLHFKYATMDAGKSTLLLQTAHNYESRGMNVQLLKSAVDTRTSNTIRSRLGLERECVVIKPDDSIMGLFDATADCILIDEAQFLTKKQVYELADIIDKWDIPVICYGLSVDFQGNLFEGSSALFALANRKEELVAMCHCGRKAHMNLRTVDGKAVKEGNQIQIGDTEYYAVCRKHFIMGKPTEDLELHVEAL